MTRTLYAAKLNKNLSRYLAFTNINNRPATASQDFLDFAIFFDSEDRAASAVEAYLNSPICKMSKENVKFITIEPFDFDCEFDTFPMTNRYVMLNTINLVDSKNYVFNRVYLEYEGFKGFGYMCTRAYRTLIK